MLKIPEFIKKEYGKTPEEIIKSKTGKEQTREITGENKPIKVSMSADECKALCEQRGITYKDGYEERVLSYVCSDESVDRAGDIIRQEGWALDNYRKNPVVMLNHDYGKMPVGNSLKEWVDGETKQLRMDILFPDSEVNEDADKTFKMASNGFMKAGSVGFLPKSVNNDMTKKEREELGMSPWGVEFLTQELLEHTVCGVPCNANALQNSIDKGIMAKKDFKNWVKEERLNELKDLEVPEKKGKEFSSDIDPVNAEKIVSALLQKVTSKEIVEKIIEVKAGAVLSKKNKDTIGKAVTAMETASAALKELLESVTNEDNTDDKDISSALDVLKIDDEPEDEEADIYADVFGDVSDELKSI